MSVEGGSISGGGTAGVGGLSIGGGAVGVGSAISVGPSMGISAPSMETGPIGGFSPSFVNEGSVAPAFLENTMPLTLNSFKPLGEIIFNPEPKVPPQTVSVADADLPSGPEAVDIVEKWLGISSQPQNDHYILNQTWTYRPREVNGNSQLRVAEPIARPTDFKWTRPEVLSFSSPELVIKPKNESKIHPNTDQIELSKIAPHGVVLTEVNKKSAQENPVRQNLEEEVLIKEKVDEKPEFSDREEVEGLKLKDLLDEETAQQRVYEISAAIDLAETEAKKEGVEEIDGPRIIKFLRLHIGLISQIARKIRKDGSLDETLAELAARKFSSKNQAKQQTKELVFEKEPVRRGKEGKTVKEGAVERVFKYHFVKRSPKDEVVSRVVKKQQVQVGNTQPQVLVVEPAVVQERRIEDTLLAEVFKRVA